MSPLAAILLGLFVVGPVLYGIARLTKTSPVLWLLLFLAVGLIAAAFFARGNL